MSLQRRIYLQRAGLLKEEQSKGHVSFFHPSRGIYKLTRHPEEDVYHVHNKFGDLSHTFSGHMTPKEISKELKDKHDMILVDKLHEEYLEEFTKKSTQTDAQKAGAKKASSELNAHRGGYNETQLAKHLNGGKHIDKEHEELDKYHKEKLSTYDKKFGTNEVEKQEHRAKEQHKVFLDHAKKAGYEGVHEVHMTHKPGDIERKTGIKASQQENPTDVAVKFKKKPASAEHHYLGISAKSSNVSKIGFHNGGAQSVGNFLTKHLG
jgi:hypothetical protein